MDDHVTDRPADLTARITDRLPSDTRIQLAPARRPRLRAALGYLAVAVAAWVVLTSQGCLPRLESEDDPRPDAVRPVSLPSLLAQAERATGDPAELGGVEAGVRRLLDNLTAATGKRGLGLPASVISAKVRTGAVLKEAHVRRKVFIAKEQVRLSHAHHCVVVCPGAVKISHGSNNVVIAGQLIEVSFDGMDFLGGVVGAPDRSALVCGGRVKVGFARDTVVAAPHIDIAHAYRVTFLGRAAGRTSFGYWCHHLDGPAVLWTSARR